MKLRGRITAGCAVAALAMLALGAPTSSAATVATTPTLTGVTIVTPTINTSADAREVAVRVRLVGSPKANITAVRLTFYRHPAPDVKENRVVFSATNRIPANATKECTSDHHATPPAPGDTTMCLVSGTVANGIFELRNLLPQWSTQGGYGLDRVEVRDSLGKSLDLNYATLLSRRQSVSFTQSGAGDSAAPLLVSTTMVNSTTTSTQQAAIVALRIHATDNQSGVYQISATFHRAIVSNGVTQYVAPEIVASAFAGRTCPAPSTISSLAGAYGYVCRESGTKLDGTYLAYFLVKRWTAQGTYEVTNLSLVDAAQNRLDDIAVDLAQANASASFTQTGLGDTDGPTVSALTVSTPVVKAKNNRFDAVVKVRGVDAISGVKQMWIDYKSVAKPTAPLMTFVSKDVACTVAAEVNHCRYSGTSFDGAWRIHSFMPATSPKGTWKIWRVRIQDNAGNLTTMTGAALTAAHLTASIKLA